MQILDGKKTSFKILEKLKKDISNLSAKPSLAIFQVGNNEASNKYISFKIKKANELNINVKHFKFDESISEDYLINQIKSNSNNFNGIIVQLPLPTNMNKSKILNSIPLDKDIDGLGNNSIYTPATPLGIMLLLEEYKIHIKDKVVGVIGQSNLVGKPMADLFEQIGAKKVLRFTKKTGISNSELCDILVVAAGEKNLVKRDNIKKDVVLIDVGINTLSNKKIVGDVDRESVGSIPRAISPVPGGVGPMTICALFINLYKASKKN